MKNLLYNVHSIALFVFWFILPFLIMLVLTEDIGKTISLGIGLHGLLTFYETR